jgi:hypothetical protein
MCGADRPYRNRAMKLATIGIGLGCTVALGGWSQRFGPSGIAKVVLIAMGARQRLASGRTSNLCGGTFLRTY